MISYGGIHLHLSAAEEAAWIEMRIPIRDAFGFFRPRWLGDPTLNPRAHFAWFLNRPFKLNAFFNPWGASRWGYAFVLADRKMHAAILAQNSGGALPFKIHDGLLNGITTPMFMLPPVPLSKITGSPGLHLLALVDERFRWWERAASISVTEGTTTWTGLYAAIASALGITLSADPISADYLKPSSGLTKHYQHLPLLLDQAAASVGQRIVRTLEGAFHARSASTGTSLMIAQANQYKKYAGGSLDLGVVNA